MLEEEFNFLFYEDDHEKLLVDDEKELALSIENIVKQKGFMVDEEFQTETNFTIQCTNDGQWVFVDIMRLF